MNSSPAVSTPPCDRPRRDPGASGRQPRGREVALLCLVFWLLVPPRAAAQDHRFSLTGYAGSAAYGNLADSADPGVPLAPGGFRGAQAELWFGRLGLRLHTGFARTALDGDPDTDFGIVAGDVDLVARLRRPRPGLFFQPYGVVGLGAVRYDLGIDTSLVGGYAYESDPTARASLVLGIGADFMGGPAAVRIELMDIIGLSSPLSRPDSSAFGPVSHVVLTLGLSLRAGRIALPPVPERPVQPTRTRVTQADTAEAPADTTARDTTGPERPQPTDTPGDTAGRRVDEPPPESVDSIRGPETDSIRGPRTDSIRGPEIDTVRVPPPTDTPVDSTDEGEEGGPPTDTLETPPTDTTDAEPPPDAPDGEPPSDTTEAPVDTTEVPGDTADAGGNTRGRLFAVRVSWDPDDAEEAAAMAALVAVLEGADVPMWEPEPDDEEPVSHRRLAALRNAADALTLGNHIEAEYGLSWEWVHIERDEDVPAAEVEASTTLVDGLSEGPGRTGRGGNPGGSGGAN